MVSNDDPVGAVVEHQRLELAADLLLGAARPQTHRASTRSASAASAASQASRSSAISPASLTSRSASTVPGGPDQLGLRRPRSSSSASNPSTVTTWLSNPSRPHAVGGRAAGQMAAAGPFDDDLGVGRLLRGLRAIAPVGGQHRRLVVGADQQRGVGTGESGQITHVDQVGYQHRVQFGGGQPATQPVPALGNCHSR